MERLIQLLLAMVKRKYLILGIECYQCLLFFLELHEPFCSTGIVDISELLDLNPSSVFLINSMTCPASMSVLLNPKTELRTQDPTSQPTTSPVSAHFVILATSENNRVYNIYSCRQKIPLLFQHNNLHGRLARVRAWHQKRSLRQMYL
jgi:hypothetical protein